VQQYVRVPGAGVGQVQNLAPDGDNVVRGVYAQTRSEHCIAVDLHQALLDEFVCLAPGADPGKRDGLVQAQPLRSRLRNRLDGAGGGCFRLLPGRLVGRVIATESLVS